MGGYVAELGGRLEVRAVFPDESVIILGPPEHEPAEDRAEPAAGPAR